MCADDIALSKTNGQIYLSCPDPSIYHVLIYLSCPDLSIYHVLIYLSCPDLSMMS